MKLAPHSSPSSCRIPLCSIPRWSSVSQSRVEPGRTHTLLALYFSRHFRSQQLWVRSHSPLNKNVSYQRASTWIFLTIIPSFWTCCRVLSMISPALKRYISNLHTLVRPKAVSVRLRVIFTGTHTHTHTQCVHVVKPTLVKKPLFKCNSAPRRKELTQQINMGVFRF